MIVKTYFKETPEGRYRAEISQNSDGFSVDYFKPSNTMFKTENFAGRSVDAVEGIVESWIGHIEQLNG